MALMALMALVALITHLRGNIERIGNKSTIIHFNPALNRGISWQEKQRAVINAKLIELKANSAYLLIVRSFGVNIIIARGANAPQIP